VPSPRLIHRSEFRSGAFDPVAAVRLDRRTDDPTPMQEYPSCAIVERAGHGAMSLWHALASCGTPGFFEIERPWPRSSAVEPGVEPRVRLVLATIGLVATNIAAKHLNSSI
jgi:hypothetical protein